MATIRNVYLGNLRTEAIHERSGEVLLTDAPVDNQGKGEKYSPTDLLAASLSTCMLTIMGIRARDAGISIDGISLEIGKVMTGGPRRVKELNVSFNMPAHNFNDEQKALLEDAAETCPVALSLHPDIKQNIAFNW